MSYFQGKGQQMPCTQNVGPYVISGDSHGLLKKWAGQLGFSIPPPQFFQEMADRRMEILRRLFSFFCVHVDEEELTLGVSRELSTSNLPIVALDQNYVTGEHVSLEVSRLCDPVTFEGKKLGSRTEESISSQVDRIANVLGQSEVQLVDDVVFSGTDLSTKIIPMLREREITVRRIVTGILIGDGRANLEASEHCAGVEIAAVREFTKVHDEICERDFLAGVPQSGRLFGNNGISVSPRTCAPYFLPFTKNGNGKCFLKDWAALNSEEMPAQVQGWSIFCIEQSTNLWREVERLSGRWVHCSQLDRRPWGIPYDDSRFVEHLTRLLEAF